MLRACTEQIRFAQLTQQRFGKVIRLFAPLYLSNECINNCAYCGFSRDNPILRVTLGLDEVVRENPTIAYDPEFNDILQARRLFQFAADPE